MKGDWHRYEPTVKRIACGILEHPEILDLPRWRVIADVRERFQCSDYAARAAYALSRIHAHKRTRRHTWPFMQRAAA